MHERQGIIIWKKEIKMKERELSVRDQSYGKTNILL